IFPDEQILIFSNRVIDIIVAKFEFVGTSMLVHYNTVHCQKAFPAPFPGLVRKIGILQVKRIVESIQPVHSQEFLFVESARPPATPKNGHVILLVVALCNLAMIHFNKSQLPFCPRLTGFLTTASLVLKKNLARYGECRFLFKSLQQRTDKLWIDLHIVIEKNHDIVFGSLEAGVVSASKAHVPRQGDYFDQGIVCP